MLHNLVFWQAATSTDILRAQSSTACRLSLHRGLYLLAKDLTLMQQANLGL